jgi:hypothetical protein
MNRLLYIFVFVILSQNVNSQPGANPYTARLTVIKGTTVEFYFNSLQKVKDGIQFDNWTVLSVCFNDPDNPGPLGTKWKLMYKANGFSGAATPPAQDILDLKIAGSGTATYYNSGNFFSLQPIGTLATSGFQGNENDNIINISYLCGKLASTLGVPPGYYTLDLELTLSAE